MKKDVVQTENMYRVKLLKWILSGLTIMLLSMDLAAAVHLSGIQGRLPRQGRRLPASTSQTNHRLQEPPSVPVRVPFRRQVQSPGVPVSLDQFQVTARLQQQPARVAQRPRAILHRSRQSGTDARLQQLQRSQLLTHHSRSNLRTSHSHILRAPIPRRAISREEWQNSRRLLRSGQAQNPVPRSVISREKWLHSRQRFPNGQVHSPLPRRSVSRNAREPFFSNARRFRMDTGRRRRQFSDFREQNRHTALSVGNRLMSSGRRERVPVSSGHFMPRIVPRPIQQPSVKLSDPMTNVLKARPANVALTPAVTDSPRRVSVQNTQRFAVQTAPRFSAQRSISRGNQAEVMNVDGKLLPQAPRGSVAVPQNVSPRQLVRQSPLSRPPTARVQSSLPQQRHVLTNVPQSVRPVSGPQLMQPTLKVSPLMLGGQQSTSHSVRSLKRVSATKRAPIRTARPVIGPRFKQPTVKISPPMLSSLQSTSNKVKSVNRVSAKKHAPVKSVRPVIGPQLKKPTVRVSLSRLHSHQPASSNVKNVKRVSTIKRAPIRSVRPVIGPQFMQPTVKVLNSLQPASSNVKSVKRVSLTKHAPIKSIRPAIGPQLKKPTVNVSPPMLHSHLPASSNVKSAKRVSTIKRAPIRSVRPVIGPQFMQPTVKVSPPVFNSIQTANNNVRIGKRVSTTKHISTKPSTNSDNNSRTRIIRVQQRVFGREQGIQSQFSKLLSIKPALSGPFNSSGSQRPKSFIGPILPITIQSKTAASPANQSKGQHILNSPIRSVNLAPSNSISPSTMVQRSKNIVSAPEQMMTDNHHASKKSPSISKIAVLQLPENNIKAKPFSTNVTLLVSDNSRGSQSQNDNSQALVAPLQLPHSIPREKKIVQPTHGHLYPQEVIRTLPTEGIRNSVDVKTNTTQVDISGDMDFTKQNSKLGRAKLEKDLLALSVPNGIKSSNVFQDKIQTLLTALNMPNDLSADIKNNSIDIVNFAGVSGPVQFQHNDSGTEVHANLLSSEGLPSTQFIQKNTDSILSSLGDPISSPVENIGNVVKIKPNIGQIIAASLQDLASNNKVVQDNIQSLLSSLVTDTDRISTHNTDLLASSVQIPPSHLPSEKRLLQGNPNQTQDQIYPQKSARDMPDISRTKSIIVPKSKPTQSKVPWIDIHLPTNAAQTQPIWSSPSQINDVSSSPQGSVAKENPPFKPNITRTENVTAVREQSARIPNKGIAAWATHNSQLAAGLQISGLGDTVSSLDFPSTLIIDGGKEAPNTQPSTPSPKPVPTTIHPLQAEVDRLREMLQNAISILDASATSQPQDPVKLLNLKSTQSSNLLHTKQDSAKLNPQLEWLGSPAPTPKLPSPQGIETTRNVNKNSLEVSNNNNVLEKTNEQLQGQEIVSWVGDSSRDHVPLVAMATLHPTTQIKTQSTIPSTSLTTAATSITESTYPADIPLPEAHLTSTTDTHMVVGSIHNMLGEIRNLIGARKLSLLHTTPHTPTTTNEEYENEFEAEDQVSVAPKPTQPTPILTTTLKSTGNTVLDAFRDIFNDIRGLLQIHQQTTPLPTTSEEEIEIEYEDGVPKTTPMPTTAATSVLSLKTPMSASRSVSCTASSPGFNCSGKGLFSKVASLGPWCIGMCVRGHCDSHVCNCTCDSPAASPMVSFVSVSNNQQSTSNTITQKNMNRKNPQRLRGNGKRFVARRRNNVGRMGRRGRGRFRSRSQPEWIGDLIWWRSATRAPPTTTTTEEPPEEEEEEIEAEDRITTTTMAPQTTPYYVDGWWNDVTVLPLYDETPSYSSVTPLIESGSFENIQASRADIKRKMTPQSPKVNSGNDTVLSLDYLNQISVNASKEIPLPTVETSTMSHSQDLSNANIGIDNTRDTLDRRWNSDPSIRDTFGRRERDWQDSRRSRDRWDRGPPLSNRNTFGRDNRRWRRRNNIDRPLRRRDRARGWDKGRDQQPLRDRANDRPLSWQEERSSRWDPAPRDNRRDTNGWVDPWDTQGQPFDWRFGLRKRWRNIQTTTPSNGEGNEANDK